MRARDVMTTAVVTVRPQTPVEEVAETLARHEISGAPVVDDQGEMVGIVSDQDLVPAQAGVPRGVLQAWYGHKPTPPTAADVMTRHVVTCHQLDGVAQVARRLLDARLRRIPVLDDAGRLVGIVTASDIIRSLTRPDARIAAGRNDLVLDVTFV